MKTSLCSAGKPHFFLFTKGIVLTSLLASSTFWLAAPTTAQDPATVTPKFLSTMPGYSVKDMTVALDFYNSQLGFKTILTNGPATSPTYAIVARGNIEISLMLDRKGERAGTGSCYIKLKGIDPVYREFVGKNVPILHELKTEEYLMREFLLKDPDGNTINFGEYVGK